jgi:hypothetical protein
VERDKIGGEAERLLAVNYSEAFYERAPTTVRFALTNTVGQQSGCWKFTLHKCRAANGMSLSISRDTFSRALYQGKRDSANE